MLRVRTPEMPTSSILGPEGRRKNKSIHLNVSFIRPLHLINDGTGWLLQFHPRAPTLFRSGDCSGIEQPVPRRAASRTVPSRPGSRSLPGISANDFSAKFTVRGGEHEEVLVLLDGIELYDAFHLKDINGGALSIVDAEAIQGIDLLTGGFPAEYGDRTSGVFNIDSRTPRTGQVRHSVGISMMNARLMSEGTFERGSWLVSARRGYLDLVLQLMNEEEDLSPKYYDLLGKVEYQLAPDHTLSAHLLHADDNLSLLEGDKDDSKTGYGNSYSWLNLKSALGPRLSVRTTLALGRVTADRNGIG